MTLTIQLSKEEEADLTAVAAEQGRDLQAYAHAVLLRQVPKPKDNLVMETEISRTKRGPNIALSEALNAWLEEDATSDPDEIARAQDDLDKWKKTLNASRAEGGERILFP